MTIGVLALQGDFDSHRVMLEEAAQGEEIRIVAVRDARALARCDALIIPGGESTVMSRLCDRYDLWEPLRARLDEGMGALGTCAGMILLSRNIEGATRNFQQKTLGALDIDVSRNAYGAQADSFETDIALDVSLQNKQERHDATRDESDKSAPHEYVLGDENNLLEAVFSSAARSSGADEESDSPRNDVLDETRLDETRLVTAASDSQMLRAVFIRAPRITRCGNDVEVLARFEGVPVVVRQGRVMAAAFHPEIAGDARLHALWLRSLNG